MDILWIIIALILTLVGIAGCIIPGLPGTPINFVAMLLVQWITPVFETSTLVIFGVLTVVVLILDYLMPIWFAKKYGATKEGIWGSIIGMILGIFFTPIGMILGMLIGAILGDVIAGRSSGDATRSGFATFFGTLLSMGLKLGVSLIISFLVIYESFNFFFAT